MNDHNEAIRLYVRDQLLDYIADGEGITSEYPHRSGMILVDWAEADRDQFRTEYGDRGCTCFISPPCGYCVHPGNPFNQEESDYCWVSVIKEV